MKRIVFFDLKGEEISIYEIEKKGNAFHVKDTFSAPVKDGGSFSIEKTFEDVEESYLSLPLSLLNFRVLELPFSDMEKAREVVPFELEGIIIGGAESTVFDVCSLRSSNGKHTILVVYIVKETLRKILEDLESFKVDPKAVTSLELAHLMTSSKSREEIANLILNPQSIHGDDRITTALKEMTIPIINLRRGEFSYTVDTEKTKRSLKLTAILLVLLVLIFLSDMAFRIITTKREISSVKNEIRKTYAGIFPNEKKITNELYQMKVHMKELKAKESTFIGISPLQFLLDLSQRSRQGIMFTDLTIEKERIILKGEAPSLSDVQQVKKSLEEFLIDVNISDAKPFSRDRTGFTITAKEKKI
jgi:type II secretory pathway component PulL